MTGDATRRCWASSRADRPRERPGAFDRARPGLRRNQTAADFHLGERFSTFFFRLNCRRPPLDNADLRRASLAWIATPSAATCSAWAKRRPTRSCRTWRFR